MTRLSATPRSLVNQQLRRLAAVNDVATVARAGQTFTGNFVLRAKAATATADITIWSDATDSTLPAAGVRLVPEGKIGANVTRSQLASCDQ